MTSIQPTIRTQHEHKTLASKAYIEVVCDIAKTIGKHHLTREGDSRDEATEFIAWASEFQANYQQRQAQGQRPGDDYYKDIEEFTLRKAKSTGYVPIEQVVTNEDGQPKFFKTSIQYDVLTQDAPFTGGFFKLANAISDGNLPPGVMSVLKSEPLTPAQVAQELVAHGQNANFFTMSGDDDVQNRIDANLLRQRGL